MKAENRSKILLFKWKNNKFALVRDYNESTAVHTSIHFFAASHINFVYILIDLFI